MLPAPRTKFKVIYLFLEYTMVPNNLSRPCHPNKYTVTDYLFQLKEKHVIFSTTTSETKATQRVKQSAQKLYLPVGNQRTILDFLCLIASDHRIFQQLQELRDQEKRKGTCSSYAPFYKCPSRHILLYLQSNEADTLWSI